MNVKHVRENGIAAFAEKRKPRFKGSKVVRAANITID